MFGRESLAGTLGERYVHLPDLGGRRRPEPDSPNGGWRNAQFRAYADHMATAEFRDGLERLLGLSQPVAIMCAEGLWWRCHRRLVADALVARGTEVEHIAPDGSPTPHVLTDFALVEDEKVTYPPVQAELG